MERTTIPFGKKMKVRNFIILKYSKSLRPNEAKALRQGKGIPDDVMKFLKRNSLPYIKVETLSGDWSSEWICSSTIFNYIDTRRYFEGENGVVFTDQSVNSLHNLFVLMYADCTVFGDQKYLEDKALALEAYMERCGNKRKDDDKADLDAIKEEEALEQAKANIVDMAKTQTKKK